MKNFIKFILASTGISYAFSFIIGIFIPVIALAFNLLLTLFCVMFYFIKPSLSEKWIANFKTRYPNLLMICQTFGIFWLFFIITIILSIMVFSFTDNYDKTDHIFSLVINYSFNIWLAVILGEIIWTVLANLFKKVKK